MITPEACEVLTAKLKEYVPARRKFITYQNLIIYFVTFITKLTIYMNETNISQHYSFSCRTIINIIKKNNKHCSLK
jgi:hypothetical protein